MFKSLFALTLAFTFISATTLTGCSTFQRKRTPNQEDDMKVVLKDQKGQVQTTSGLPAVRDGKEVTPISPEATTAAQSEAQAQTQAQEMKEAVSAAATQIAISHAKTEGRMVRVPGPVVADKALGWLKNGNTRFAKGFLRNDGTAMADRLKTAGMHRPHSVIIASSDSRVPPEVIFDQKLGEVFVIRSLEPNFDSSMLSSVEYGVSDLGANLVVVLGNSADVPWTPVDEIYKDLMDRSEILRDAVASGDVKVVRAVYDLQSGLVTWAL